MNCKECGTQTFDGDYICADCNKNVEHCVNCDAALLLSEECEFDGEIYCECCYDEIDRD